MDTITVPYKTAISVRTYLGDWTEDERAAGIAVESQPEIVSEAWYDPTPDGPVEITDPARIASLEARLAAKQKGS